MKQKALITALLSLILLACHTSKKMPYSRAELKQRTFHYFWDQALPENHQIPDRYPSLTFSSIAATGFGLSAYITGVENHYISREEAAERTLKTLNFLYHLPQHDKVSGAGGYKGFFYHFLTLDKALRYKDVELSSIDTGLLMAGILSALSYFDKETSTEKEIRQMADALYRRVEWDWMLQDDGYLSMGWHPEKGFIPARWKGYNEAMILLIMAMGSPTHPIPASSWDKWCEGYEYNTFMGETNIQFDPLFGHQYSHVWIDFRGIKDKYMEAHHSDYFINSTKATKSNRAYCISNPAKHEHYNKQCWGLTACDGPYSGEKNIDGQKRIFFDYRARGAASMQVIDDGTIAPTAAGGSVPFLPNECEAAMEYMWNTYYDQLIGPYGFKDAFNCTYKDTMHPNGWFDIDYLGIDQGPILLQMENHQTALLWNIMKKNPYIVEGLKKAGFKGGWLDKQIQINHKN